MNKEKRILVIDDEVDFVHSITDRSDVLRDCIIHTAASVDEAKELMQKPIYDVIICDLNIDGKYSDGIGLNTQYNDTAFAIGIQSYVDKIAYWIFVSGNGVELETRVKNIRNSTYLAKPFDPDRLIGLISGFFNKERFEKVEDQIKEVYESVDKVAKQNEDILIKLDDLFIILTPKIEDGKTEEEEFTGWLSKIKNFCTNTYVKYVFYFTVVAIIFASGKYSVKVNEKGFGLETQQNQKQNDKHKTEGK